MRKGSNVGKIRFKKTTKNARDLTRTPLGFFYINALIWECVHMYGNVYMCMGMCICKLHVYVHVCGNVYI